MAALRPAGAAQATDRDFRPEFRPARGTHSLSAYGSDEGPGHIMKVLTAVQREGKYGRVVRGSVARAVPAAPLGGPPVPATKTSSVLSQIPRALSAAVTLRTPSSRIDAIAATALSDFLDHLTADVAGHDD